MTDRYFLVALSSRRIDAAVLGYVEEPGYVTVAIPDGSPAWIGWTYTVDGEFVPPPPEPQPDTEAEVPA